MVLKYSQSYSISSVEAVRLLGDGVPHFVDGGMRSYELVNRYIADHFRRWSANTTRTVAENLHEFLRWTETSNLDLDSVKLRHLELYVNALIAYRKPLSRRQRMQNDAIAMPLSLSTVVQRVKHVCMFYHWTKRKKDIVNAWDGDGDAERTLSGCTRGLYRGKASESITPRVVRSLTRFLYLPNAIKFIECLGESTGQEYPDLIIRNQLMGKVMLKVGLRVAEVVSIPANWVSEIEIDDRRPMQLGRVEGKGGKRRPIEWPTKLLLELQEYIDFQRQRVVETAEQLPEGCVEPSELFLAENALPITTNWVDKLFQRNSVLSGIHCTPHMMRHTYGTYHYLIHQDLAKLATLMGHSSQETTRNCLCAHRGARVKDWILRRLPEGNRQESRH